MWNHARKFAEFSTQMTTSPMSSSGRAGESFENILCMYDFHDFTNPCNGAKLSEQTQKPAR
jgi:hypothetical protein